MFSWNFAKSAEAIFSRWAIKKVCKFLLKKKLGQLIIGDIDLNQLDVQLSNGTIQLSDLALNVDYINNKFGTAAILVVKEGSIGSLSVKLPWKGRGCEIEVDELELVLAPVGNTHFQCGDGTSCSGQNDDGRISHDLVTHEHEMADSTLTTTSVDIHEGVKTIAKMVKWLLTSFHVKVNKLIIALDPSGELKNNGICRTLVLRFSEVECGTGISEDVDPNCQATADRFLGLSRLTNFVKFDGAVLEFLQLDGDDSQSVFPSTSGETFGEWFSGYSSSMATSPIITGGEGGFSGTVRLSIPWKNGSLDIRKVDADVYVDPLELRLQPSSLKSFMHLVHVFEELDKSRKSFMQCESMESIYESAASHDHSSTSGSFEFDTDKLSHMPDTISAESYSSSSKDTVFDALLRGSHLISDWVTSPIGINQNRKPEESDFGASVDQFFECFDELRTSQSALGNSGMWNWTCSVFSAITAASNLASGSLHIPSEQKHVETSLKARITQIVILFSFVDEDKSSCGIKGSKMDSTSYVHYIAANFHEMQLVWQVCPRELNFEATVKNIEVADHFSHEYDLSDGGLHGQNKDPKARSSLIRNKQAAVQSACPPLGLLVQGAVNASSNICSRNCRGIYRDDVVKVLLLQTSAFSQVQYVVTSVSRDGKSAGRKSFSVKLPPLIFWVNFSLISTGLDLLKAIGNSLERCSKDNLYPSVDGNSTSSTRADNANNFSRPQYMGSPEETLRGNISLMDARIILCFPCEKSENCKSYLSWNQFIVIDFSSPLALRDEKFRQNSPAVPILKERYTVRTSQSLHFNVGNFAAYIITSASKDNNNNSLEMQMLKFHAENVLSVSNKAGLPSVFSMLWQESSVTGPWITKRAKVLATSDSTGSRNKSTGKGHEFASVATPKDMEDFNSRAREEIVLSSSFLLHAHLSPIIVNLDSSLYKDIHDLLHQLADCLSCITSNPVETTESHSPSQTSILVECESVEISVSVKPVAAIKGSIHNELPGSWCSLKLRVDKFELLNVSNTGGTQGANFLWVAHGEGNLWGSTTGVHTEFVLISCKNSTRGRGNGEGSNIFSSRFPGSDIIHMWDPENFVSQVSVNIRCATIVATGGRLDWFITIISFFSSDSAEDDRVHENISETENLKKDASYGSSLVLNLIDIGLSYEPHSSDNMDEQYVAGLLAASTLKLSNVSTANSVETDYKIKAYDMGLLLCEVSGQNNLGGSYCEQNLRKNGYVKVAEEAHADVDLRMNCKNGHIWEVECSESHIVLETCQDTAFGLIRLASQLQKIYAPDVEETMVHLQNRWDIVQQAQESYKSRSSSNQFTSSSSQVHSVSLDTKSQTSTVNLMDEISEGAFSWNRDGDNRLGEVHAFSSGLSVTGPVPEFIEGYFLSDLRPLSELPLKNQSYKESLSTKSRNTKDAEARGGISGWYGDSLLNNQSYKESLSAKSRNTKDAEARGGISGWYGDSPLRILENHVGEKTKSKELQESEASVSQTGCSKVKGQVLLENINIRWRLYAGNDWQLQTNVQNGVRDTTVCLELALLKMGMRYDVFPDGEICVSRLSLSVEDLRLNDISNDAPWIQMLSGYQSKDHPRVSCSRALKLDLEAVRPHPSTPLEEYRLRIALFPLRLHLHQSQLDFLVNYFGGKNSSHDQSLSPQDMEDPQTPQKNKIYQESHDIKEEALLPFFQKFSISPVLVRVDYSPSRVDLAALRRGKYVELVNLVPWKGIELQLKHVQAVGVYGWSSVCETIIGEWLEDISHNQIHKILKGLPPIRSLVAVGSSAAKLVSLPVKNYKKDRRIDKGMQRGTIAFLRSISLEAIGLGVHLAAGAHDILLQAEYILTSVPPSSVPRPLQSRSNPNVRSNQPTDARQGIQQAFESITDGLGKSASALVQTPLKKYQRGASVGSALSSAVQAAPGAAIAPASAAARAMHSALLGVRNSLDPERKKESMDKYLGATHSQPR